MRGASAFISSLVLTVSALFAQTPDFFPLDVGNVWIYRARQTVARQSGITVEVTRAESFNGIRYYLLSGYRNDNFWVRSDGQGRVFQYDEKAGEEKLWYDFSRPEDDVYPTALPTCCGRARVESVAATKTVALGTFEKAFFQLSYPGVFQVGITEEGFLPYIGLVYRSENTGGPSFRTQDLIYAKLSGVTVLNASGIGFGVAVRDGYARIFLNNNTGEPVRLIFPRGFVYDLVLRDDAGKELYRWSLGKLPPREPGSQVVPTGETSWLAEIPATPGAATVEVELLSAGLHYTASAPLRPARP